MSQSKKQKRKGGSTMARGVGLEVEEPKKAKVEPKAEPIEEVKAEVEAEEEKPKKATKKK